MATINQIPMTLMGNLVSDLEPKRTAGGKTVVNFRVAQTSVTEKNGKWEDGETTFIRCVAYGILADHMIASGIRKGTRVIVSGRYVQRDWQTETGERRSSYELNVDDLGYMLWDRCYGMCNRQCWQWELVSAHSTCVNEILRKAGIDWPVDGIPSIDKPIITINLAIN